MGESQQHQQQQLKFANLEKRVTNLEKLLRILDSELNNKVRWIMKTIGAIKAQQRQGHMVMAGSSLRLPPPATRPRVLQRRAPRNKPPMTFHPPTRFMIPEVQFDEEEEEEDNEEEYMRVEEEQNEADADEDADAWSSPHPQPVMHMEMVDDCDNDVEEESNFFCDESDAAADPLGLGRLESGEDPEDEDEEDESQAIVAEGGGQDLDLDNEISPEIPWRFDSQEKDQTEDGQDHDGAEDVLPIQAHFMDVSQPRSSAVPMIGRLAPRGLVSRNRVRRVGIQSANNVRLIQVRNGPASVISSKPGSKIIVPRNRYLMSSSLIARLQQQKLLANMGTKISEVKTSPLKKTTTPSSNTNASTVVVTSDSKEKVYYCDRCPLTFTLSTRHAHYELHKQMDLQKKQQNNTKTTSSRRKIPPTDVGNGNGKGKNKSNPKSLLKPISSLSPPRKTRVRPRKVCPICTKSYSRNQYLRNHMEDHRPDYPHMCTECFTVYQSEKELEDHCQASDRCFISTYQP